MKYLTDLAKQMEAIGLKDSDSFIITAVEGQPAVVQILGAEIQLFVQNENLDSLDRYIGEK